MERPQSLCEDQPPPPYQPIEDHPKEEEQKKEKKPDGTWAEDTHKGEQEEYEEEGEEGEGGSGRGVQPTMTPPPSLPLVHEPPAATAIPTIAATTRLESISRHPASCIATTTPSSSPSCPPILAAATTGTTTTTLTRIDSRTSLEPSTITFPCSYAPTLPRPVRLRNLQVTNAILQESSFAKAREEVLKSVEDPRELRMTPLQLHFPPLDLTAQAWEVLMQKRRQQGQPDMLQGTTTLFQNHPRSRRFQKVKQPPPYQDGMDMYMPRFLRDMGGDVRTIVLGRWLGRVRLTFWVLREGCMKRRPKVEAIRRRVALREKHFRMAWWVKRMVLDRIVGPRVRVYNLAKLRYHFNQMYAFSVTLRNCKTVILRFFRLQFGEKFHRWVNAAREMREQDPPVVKTMTEIQKKRVVFRAIQIYASRRMRVKQRAGCQLRILHKLQLRMLLRWHKHATNMTKQASLIYSRFLPLQRKVFYAWLALCEHLDYHSSSHNFKLKDNQGKPLIFDVLSKRGRAQFISFHGGGGGDAARRSSRLELSTAIAVSRPIVPLEDVEATEVFSRQGVTILASVPRLDAIRAQVHKKERAALTKVAVAHMDRISNKPPHYDYSIDEVTLERMRMQSMEYRRMSLATHHMEDALALGPGLGSAAEK